MNSNNFKIEQTCIKKINNLKCSEQELIKIENYAKYMSFKKSKKCGVEVRELLCNGVCSFDKNVFAEKNSLKSADSKTNFFN